MGHRSARSDRPRVFAAEIGRLLRFIDRPDLAPELGLPSALLGDPEATVPIDVWYDFVEAVTVASGDPFLGLHFGIKSQVDFREAAGAMRLMILSSDTLRVAVDRALRYQSYWNDAEHYQLDERDGKLVVRYATCGPRRPAHVQLAEKTAAQAVRFVRVAVPGNVPDAVRFPHPRRAGAEELTRLLGVEPSFDFACTEIVFQSWVFDTKLPSADAVLFRVLDRHLAERVRDAKSGGSHADRARKAIADYLHREELTIDAVARVLGTSARTLQRRLSSEGTSFRDLVDEVRRSRAIALLDTGASVAELSLHLGYAEETTFYRAFRRWTGATPDSWRSRQGHDPHHRDSSLS